MSYEEKTQQISPHGYTCDMNGGVVDALIPRWKAKEIAAEADEQLASCNAGIAALQAELEKRTAENAELRKDAERYRWLRDIADRDIHFDHTLSDSFGGNYHELKVPFESTCLRRGPSLDEAIDAAITGAAK